jgi:hypothetical protein
MREESLGCGIEDCDIDRFFVDDVLVLFKQEDVLCGRRIWGRIRQVIGGEERPRRGNSHGPRRITRASR